MERAEVTLTPVACVVLQYLVEIGDIGGFDTDVHGIDHGRGPYGDNSASATAGQPAAWTFVHWETDDDGAAGRIAEALTDAMEPALGWYADFTVGDERVVVFAGRPRGGSRISMQPPLAR
jgi:hypothetical protein